MQNTQLPASGLLRITAAAQIVGITPETMRAALNSHQIPIASVQIGKRQFVRAAELHAWVSSAPAPASANLFR